MKRFYTKFDREKMKRDGVYTDFIDDIIARVKAIDPDFTVDGKWIIAKDIPTPPEHGYYQWIEEDAEQDKSVS